MKRKIRYILEYWLVRAADAIFYVLGPDISLPLARFMGTVAFFISSRYRKVALDNLAMAYGSVLDKREMRHIAMRAFQNLFVTAAEFPLFLHHAKPENLDDYVRFVNADEFEVWLASGRPAIIVSGHIGNWEMGACAISMRFAPCFSIARPLKNPLLDSWLTEKRERLGAHVFPKSGALKSIVRRLKEGKLLVFLLDQHAGDKGIPVEFFGMPAFTFDSVAALSKRFDVPVFVGFDRRIGNEFFHEMICLARVDPSEGTVEALTQRYTKLLELAIRQVPDQWLWMHRRWKKSKSRDQRRQPAHDPQES